MKKIATTAAGLSILVALTACNAEGEFEATPAATTGEQVSRIVGGTTFDGLPAVGSLVYNGEQHCTGTVIGPRKVLTAAHCVDGYQASRMRFVIGPSITNPQVVIPVASMQGHPAYNPWSITNDIAVVYLASDAPVEPMGVVTNMDSSWVGANLFFVGYGVSNGYYHSGAGIKRAVWMAISRVSATTFRYDDPQRNTCAGDSGGPAFYRDENGRYLVAGVTSYGDHYCREYGVNARTDTYLDFLGISPEPEPVEDPCEGETYEGRCDGNTVVWCENDQVQRKNCSASAMVCELVQSHGYFACVEPAANELPPAEPPPAEPVDPCGGETYAGRCDGETIVWCEQEQVRQQDCSSSGKVCGYSEQHSYYGCIEAPVEVDPCGGESYEGRCDGDTVIWCQNEEVMSLDCGPYNRTCGYSSSHSYYGCM